MCRNHSARFVGLVVYSRRKVSLLVRTIMIHVVGINYFFTRLLKFNFQRTMVRILVLGLSGFLWTLTLLQTLFHIFSERYELSTNILFSFYKYYNIFLVKSQISLTVFSLYYLIKTFDILEGRRLRLIYPSLCTLLNFYSAIPGH